MAHDHHRMIYYQPDDSEPLPTGVLHYPGNTGVLLAIGQLRVLVDPSSGGEGVRAAADAIVQTVAASAWLDRLLTPATNREMPVITVPAAVDRLEQHGFENVHPMGIWQRIALRKGDASFTITAIPGYSSQEAMECDLMSAVVELRPRPEAEPYTLFLSGRACTTAKLTEIAGRFPRIDLAVLVLGDGRGSAIEITRALRPAGVVSIPDVPSASLLRFRDALRQANLAPRVHVLAPGQRLALDGPGRTATRRPAGAPNIRSGEAAHPLPVSPPRATGRPYPFMFGTAGMTSSTPPERNAL